MFRKIFLLLFITASLATGVQAQIERRNYAGDTIEHREYFNDGKLRIYSSYITQTPEYIYSKKRWYLSDGTMILYDSIDMAKNILFIGIYRRDGSTQLELEERDPNFTLTYSDKKSNPTDIYTGRMNEKICHWEHYHNGEKVFDSLLNRFYDPRYDTIRYYEKVITKSNKQINKNYSMEEGAKFTLNRHIRMVYNTDSVLLSEGLYKSNIGNVGYFIQYYPDGSIACIGEYDSRGIKNNDWYYFDEKGACIKREHYYRAVNLFN